MHARLELPSIMSERTELAVRNAPRRTHDLEVHRRNRRSSTAAIAA
jgi:hypothetical protein